MSQKDSSIRLSSQEKDKCYEVFKIFDLNGKESFGIRELEKIMQRYGMNPSSNEVKGND